MEYLLPPLSEREDVRHRCRHASKRVSWIAYRVEALMLPSFAPGRSLPASDEDDDDEEDEDDSSVEVDVVVAVTAALSLREDEEAPWPGSLISRE